MVLRELLVALLPLALDALALHYLWPWPWPWLSDLGHDTAGLVDHLKGRGVNWLHLAIQVKPTFLISDIRALWRSELSAKMSECQKLKKG